MFNREIRHLPVKIAKQFYTTCFTETPLNQLHLLVRDIPGRRVKLAPYGVCFSKDFIVRKGGQPALYINEYNGNTWLRDCVDKLYETSVSAEKVTRPLGVSCPS